MVRSEAAAEESLAAIRARIKFGIAIAAMIRIIATTISSSISEKPFCFRIARSSPFQGRSEVRNIQRRKVLVACGGPSRDDGVPRLQSWQPLCFQPGADRSQHAQRKEGSLGKCAFSGLTNS